MPSAIKPTTRPSGNGVAKKTKAGSIAVLLSPAEMMDSAPDAPDAQAQQTAPSEPAPAFLQLLLLMHALGREPEEGWFRATGLTKEQVTELCRQHAGKLVGLRLATAAMKVLTDEDLAALARTTLVDRLLTASTENDTAAMLKLVDKAAALSMRARLGSAARAATPAATQDERSAQPLREYSVKEAVAEARLILDALNAEQQLGAEAMAQLGRPLELLAAPEEQQDSGARIQESGEKAPGIKTQDAAGKKDAGARRQDSEEEGAHKPRRATPALLAESCTLHPESYPQAGAMVAAALPADVALAAPAESSEVRQ
jgi:hypothetical protein